ncbi:hypothetical protein ACWGOK_41230 [Streptomyces eurythermus]
MPIPTPPDRSAAASSRAVQRWLEGRIKGCMKQRTVETTARLKAEQPK